MANHDHDHNHEHNNQDWLTNNIKAFGWAVIMVEGSDYLPSFAYTVGLWKNYQHPEVIAFGLSTETLHLFLNDAGDRVKAGQRLATGTLYHDFFEDSAAAQFIPVDNRHLADYFGQAIEWYGTADFPAIQFVWPDRNDKFPWDTDYEEALAGLQPLLDRNADFKFREAKDLGIFTTRQWLDEGAPILRVVHDTDGDWQFLTSDPQPDDIRLVALEQMVASDATLNEVFNLDYGEAAEREHAGAPWARTGTDDDEEE